MYGKEFGQFDVENTSISKGYFVGKKQYLLINEKGECDNGKMKFKGYPIKKYCNLTTKPDNKITLEDARGQFNNPTMKLEYNDKKINGRNVSELEITKAYEKYVYQPLVDGETLYAVQNQFKINKMTQHCTTGVRMNYIIKKLRGQGVGDEE